MIRDPRPRDQDVDNYMRELEALGFSDRVPRSRDEAMVWQWQDKIRDQPTHEQLLNLIARVRADERTCGCKFWSGYAAALRDAEQAITPRMNGQTAMPFPEAVRAIRALNGER